MFFTYLSVYVYECGLFGYVNGATEDFKLKVHDHSVARSNFTVTYASVRQQQNVKAVNE
jgi:hypothetical protein